MIGVILTTFLRNELLKDSINSIIESLSNIDYILIIGDQNKEITYNYPISDNIIVVPLPYDCGLSYARNRLCEYAYTLGCEYIILSADSIQFKDFKNLPTIISDMQEYNINLIGFNLLDRQPYEYNLELNNGFILHHTNEKISNYKKCEIVKNFFIANTKSIINTKWDNELKLCEHEDFFIRYKINGYKVAYTDKVTGKYIDFKPPEYRKMRNRLYDKYKKVLLEKYNIKNWLIYKNNS